MSRQTFSWFPDLEPEQTVKPSVNVTKFGDGYEARVVSGINSQPMSWSLGFTVTRAIGFDILNFLRARGGQEAFNWANPLQESGVYVCREWRQRSLKGGFFQITCTFEQVFEA